MTQDENLETALVPYNGSSLLPAAHQKFVAAVEINSIPESELADNQRFLREKIRGDEERRRTYIEQAVADYEKTNSWPVRFFKAIARRGRYIPDIPETKPSPERELFENLVDLQQAVMKGHDLLLGLPKIVEQMTFDYTSLEARERKLLEQIKRTEHLITDLPGKILAYEEARRDLVNYDGNNDDRKTSLQDLFLVAGDSQPSIEKPEVRTVLVGYIDSAINQLQSNSLGSDSMLEMDKEELSRVCGDKELLIKQYHELKEGWRPALEALHKLKRQYDSVKRFAPSARLAIGMNHLREETVELIAESEQAIAKALAAIDDSKTRAETAEAIDAEVRGLLESGN